MQSSLFHQTLNDKMEEFRYFSIISFFYIDIVSRSLYSQKYINKNVYFLRKNESEQMKDRLNFTFEEKKKYFYFLFSLKIKI